MTIIDLDVVLPALLGGITGSILGISAQLLSFRHRKSVDRKKYGQMRLFLAKHVNRSIASLKELDGKSDRFKIRGRLSMCTFGDIIQPTELIKVVAGANVFDTAPLTIAFHIRNSDLIINELLKEFDAHDSDTGLVIHEAVTNMRHLLRSLENK
jgi:hypothetical protein